MCLSIHCVNQAEGSNRVETTLVFLGNTNNPHRTSCSLWKNRRSRKTAVGYPKSARMDRRLTQYIVPYSGSNHKKGNFQNTTETYCHKCSKKMNSSCNGIFVIVNTSCCDGPHEKRQLQHSIDEKWRNLEESPP